MDLTSRAGQSIWVRYSLEGKTFTTRLDPIHQKVEWQCSKTGFRFNAKGRQCGKGSRGGPLRQVVEILPGPPVKVS